MKATEILIIGLGLCLIVGGVGVVAHQRLAPAPIPAAAIPLERALAGPGLLAIGSVNVRSLARIEAHAFGEVDEAAPAAEDEELSVLGAVLAHAGVDPRRDLTLVTAAAYVGAAEGVELALAAFGRFDPTALADALQNTPGVETQATRAGGQPALQVTLVDRESCEPSGPWGVHLTEDRILVSHLSRLGPLLDALAGDVAPDRDLARFQAYRAGQVASAALFVPESLPAGIDNPFLRMPAEAAREQLLGFDALYVGAVTRLLPPGATLAAMLEGVDPGTASQTAERWQGALDAAVSRFGSDLPSVAALRDSLDIEAQGSELHLALALDSETGGQLGDVGGEVLGLLLGGLGDVSFGESDEPVEERIEEKPAAFAAQYPASSLGAYDPEQVFTGPADATHGPFGLRVHRVALPADPAASGPEIEVEALATGVGNLDDSGDRAQLRVTSALDAEGRELLREEACGTDRNDRPEMLTRMFRDDPFKATKTVRLRAGAQLDDVARLSGRVSLRLPVATESVILSAPLEGAVAERAGARVEISSAGRSTVSWRTRGAVDRVLLVRALNAAGQVLDRGSWTGSDGLFGGGRSDSGSYAGQVAQVEVVFATEEERLEYPFALDSLRPRPTRENVGPTSPAFVDYSARRLKREFGRSRPPLPKEGMRTVAVAGPFAVALEDLWGYGGLMPRFKVHAPAAPNFEHAMNAVEIELERILLADGGVRTESDPPPEGMGMVFSTVEPRWKTYVALAPSGEAGRLQGDVSLETGAPVEAEQVSGLEGRLVARLPRRVTTLVLDDVSLGSSVRSAGLSVSLASLGRDRFGLRAGANGERVLGVRALNAKGEELWMTGVETETTDLQWTGEFEVAGEIDRIEIAVATELDTVRIPFSLRF